MIKNHILILLFCSVIFPFCKKSGDSQSVGAFKYLFATINDKSVNNPVSYNSTKPPLIKLYFSDKVDSSSARSLISINETTGLGINVAYSFINNDSIVVLAPLVALKPLTTYSIKISYGLKSVNLGALQNSVNLNFVTTIDSTDKFPLLSDSALLTLVQQQTFNYFWKFGHPICGMARERTSSGDVVTIGGSGFGIMGMLAAVNRNFITRAAALSRIDTIVNFLTNKVTRYHGVFPHWINGSTGATIPFGTQDNGADLVETSYMIQGLLCARQFFNSTTDSHEINLRTAINNIYNGVEWNWFRQNNQNVLTWNWSPNFGWAINVQVRGWDEALITYVLAASSPIDSNAITKTVYDNGWAQNGGMKNGRSFYGITLPLGPHYGGPLFFAHYSFLGINPYGLTDNYANYWTQDTAHATINFTYCVNNPNHYNGYSYACWGLTASDVQSGYNASSPTNDVGVIAPTAAISSIPYTPKQSMDAIRFFYYKLGDKIWSQYGFIDAFNLSSIWYDSDCLAIDQGPQIVMIENYRTGLLWNLFMSCPEIKHGMKSLGFQSPYF